MSRRGLLGGAGAVAAGSVLGAAVEAPAGAVVPTVARGTAAPRPVGARRVAALDHAHAAGEAGDVGLDVFALGPWDFVGPTSGAGSLVYDADGVGLSGVGQVIASLSGLPDGVGIFAVAIAAKGAGTAFTVELVQAEPGEAQVVRATASVPATATVGTPVELEFDDADDGLYDATLGLLFVRVTFTNAAQRIGAARMVVDDYRGGVRIITPTRFLDTRAAGGGGAFASGQTRTYDLTDLGVPSFATAALVNVTIVGTTGSGFVSAYPGGEDFPGTSTINWSGPNQILATSAIVALGFPALLSLRAGGGGGTHVVLDVGGWVLGGVVP